MVQVHKLKYLKFIFISSDTFTTHKKQKFRAGQLKLKANVNIKEVNHNYTYAAKLCVCACVCVRARVCVNTILI